MKQSALCSAAAAADPCRDCRPQMRDAVRRVAEHFPTAIVSGRCIDKVPVPFQLLRQLIFHPCLLAVATSSRFFLKKKVCLFSCLVGALPLQTDSTVKRIFQVSFCTADILDVV
jgi:hypothetical protein